MKKVISFVLTLALAGIIGLTAGCKREEKKPTNATANVTNVTANVTNVTANVTANVTTNATANVTNATKK